ncbi:hypothetical protein D3C71_2015330 [compost metagenome]
MGNVLINKTAHNVNDGVHFANMGQKLVAQSFALAGAGNQAGNIYKFKCRWHDAFRHNQLNQLV